MLHNQHKRIAKVKRQVGFSPTWLGNEPTSTAAVLPPVATTPNPVPTTVSTPPPAPPVQTSLVQLSTNTPTTTQSTSAPATTEEPTTSSAVSTTQVVSTTSSISSTTPVTSAAPATTAPQQTTARVNTQSLVRSTTPSVTRNVATLTNSQGGVFYSTIVVGPSETPTETATPTPSNVGTIMGAIAGGLVGVVCLIAFVSWLIRQHNKRKNRNHDDFDRQSYLRNSMMIPDEPARPVIGTQAALALARQNNPHTGPRPPTMIERKATLGPSFGPGQVVSFEPGQVVSAPPTGDGAYPSPMAFAAYTPPAQHHQSELSRRPSGAQLLTRQPTNGGMYDGHYAQTPSPGGYGSEYHAQSPNGYHDGYTYPMHPGIAAERGMVQSVTPYQAQQYAEITRALEGPDFAAPHESFHPISPVASPVGQAVSDDNASAFAPSSTHEKPMPNPFDDHKRVDSIPPSLPPFETLSRTGTPIDPNPQHAHYSFDAKGQGEGNRLSVAGISAPVVQPPALPPAAHTREERTVVVGNGEEHKAKRPVSLVDTDDAYGGM